MTEILPSYLDATRVAVASFLARYREPALAAYKVDLKTFLSWCRTVDVEPLRITRGQLEMDVRHLERCGYASATVSRRFTTVASFYRYAVIDGALPTNPASAVTRPKVAWEGQRRTVLHPLEFAALLAAARAAPPTDHALVALLGMVGLRVYRRPATPTSEIFATRAATRSCTSSARVPSRLTSHCPSRCSAPSATRPLVGMPVPSCVATRIPG
jgi:site-specific recombinase XerD